ncbi:MAG TPA: DNA polymerase III subunit beta [Nevskiaceae bacterium]|nr:DNA polymerase III subunit beta [Nevskiaceae bacterium]
MKLQVSRNELLQTLQSVVGVVERRQTLPVLSNFLLVVEDDSLTVTGTDLEMELVARARVQNLAPGRITVPARKLFDICRGLPEGAELTLELQEDRLAVRSGRSRFSLATLRAEEFPAFSSSGGGRSVTVSRRELKSLIERTQFAMAQQDVRYYLNGLLLDVHPKRLRAVATDGHRLAFSELTRDTGVSESFQAILPRKSVQELARVLDASDEEVVLQIAQGQVQVDLDVVRLSTKTIDGRFPDYERVIPDNGDKQVLCDRETLRRALARTAILSNEKFRGVRLQLSNGELKLQTHNPEHEEAEEEVEVEYQGAALEIGFNVNYLMDALAALDAERVVMELKNADSSGLLHAEGDRGSKYVIMPMRL